MLNNTSPLNSAAQKIKHFLLLPNTITIVYLLLAVLAGVQAILLSQPNLSNKIYTEYNNYVIFKNSFFHLLAGKNLFVLYPTEQWDLYKYSPTFALVMGIFAYLPDVVGLCLWNTINASALLWGIRLLPFNTKTQSLLLWLVALELLTSLQNAQSNGLMAGLMIAAFGCMQGGKVKWATLWLVIATFIKVYGAVGFCIFLFYPNKLKFTGYALFWSIVLAIMPLLIPSVTPPALIEQYKNWAVMMAADQSTSYGLSVMGWLHSWFGVEKGKGLVSIIGMLLFLIPFCRYKMYKNEMYKLLILASMLVWVIIFNHKAESPTFIIAVAGVGIWYFAGPRSAWRNLLLITVFIFTCMSPTDLFPKLIRDQFFVPYKIKALPCIILWCVMFVDIMRLKIGAKVSEITSKN